MKPKFFIAALAVAAQFAFTTPSNSIEMKATQISSPNDWKVLGTRTVNFNTDNDVITNGSPDTWFKGIYFKVTGAPIKINDMKVYFDNGDKFDVSIRSNIREGGHSRTIELPGGLRKITKVEFSYETLGSNRGNATLTLWGKY